MSLRVALAVAFALALSGPALGKIESIPLADIAPAPDHIGELAVVDAGGHMLRRYTGLADPRLLRRVSADRFVVLDRGLRRLFEFDQRGQIQWQVELPEDLGIATAMAVVGTDRFVLGLDNHGLAEIDRTGKVLWRIPSPLPSRPITGVVRTPDGGTLVTLWTAGEPNLFLCRPDAEKCQPVPLTLPGESRPQYMGTAWTRDGREILLWNVGAPHAYRCKYESGSLTLLGTIRLPNDITQIFPDDQGNFTYIGEFLIAGQVLANETFDELNQPRNNFQTDYQSTGLISGPAPGQYWTIHQREAERSWPEALAPPPPEYAFRWDILVRYLAAAVGMWLFLQWLIWHIEARRPPPAAAPPDAPDTTPPASRWWWAVLAILVTAAGAAAAGVGQYRLRHDFGPHWLALYAGGALLAAIALEIWRRRGLRAPMPFWRASQAQRVEGVVWQAWLLAAVALSAGVGTLFYWNWIQGGYAYPHRASLWIALNVFVIGCSALCSRAPRRRRWSDLRPDAGYLGLALAVACFTFLYRVTEIPDNCHFDFGYYARAAWELLNGYYRDFWDYGFVPAPVVGTLPQMVGFLLAGPSLLGFRLGSALFGLTAIVAVYLLGRVYHSRRVGFLAAIFLAGNVPFMHFTRIPTAGDAATAALWTLTFAVLGIRYAHPRWWLLAGFAAGHCFYLWPVARVGPLALAIGGVLLVVRAPRLALRRWYGPVLLLLAALVWLSPLMPGWLRNTHSAFPRAQESFAAYKVGQGVDWNFVKESLGTPFQLSAGWFYVYTDSSSQGTGREEGGGSLNDVEAVLFTIGVGLILLEGYGLNALFLTQLVLVIFLCGAWSRDPPFYTRLLPTVPIAALLMGRTLTAATDLFRTAPRWLRAGIWAALIAAVLWCSPVYNWQRYAAYETGATGRYTQHAMTAIGRALRELGPRYHYYLVITKQFDWTVHNPSKGGRWGELMPFVWNLHVSEIRQLSEFLPLPANEPAILVLQPRRIAEDLALIRQFHPNATVRELRSRRGDLHAGLVEIPAAKP